MSRSATQRALELSHLKNSDELIWNIAKSYLFEGQPALAATWSAKLKAEDDQLAGRAAVEHALGHPAEARAALNKLIVKLGATSPYRIACHYAWRGEVDSAFDWLGRAYTARDNDLGEIKNDPWLKPLRRDSRYTVLVKKMNLPVDLPTPARRCSIQVQVANLDAGTLISELKRRRVIRALVGYGIAAFAVLQIVEPVMHGLHWSDEVLSYVVVALAVGFPVVVTLAWIFDVNAGRIERTAATTEGLKGTRLALVLVGIGVFAAAPGTIWYFFVRTHAGATVEHGPSAPSIAVLPFADLSPQHDQEYLAEGLTVELLSALAQVPKLHVAGRISSSSFKEKNVSIGQIGSELHVASLLQGSVQKAGNRVRITAQLVNVVDGYHLWAQTFDRELNDVFAIEAEIARAVTATLKVKLRMDAPPPGSELNLRPEAREHLLLGLYLVDHGIGEANSRRAQEEFEKAVALDPGSATARATLAETLAARATAIPDASARAAALQRALTEANAAVQLDVRSSNALRTRGLIRMLFFDWEAAGRDLELAFVLAPGDANVLYVRAWLLETVGKLSEALEMTKAGTSLEPLDSDLWARYGAELLASGHLGQARSALERSMELQPLQGWQSPFFLGTLEMQEGHFDKALSAYQKCTADGFRLAGVAIAEGASGHARESQLALDELIEKYSGYDAYQVVWVYVYRGEVDHAFQWLDRAYAQRDSGLTRLKWDPLLGKLRGDPRYTALLKKMNLPPH